MLKIVERDEQQSMSGVVMANRMRRAVPTSIQYSINLSNYYGSIKLDRSLYAAFHRGHPQHAKVNSTI